MLRKSACDCVTGHLRTKIGLRKEALLCYKLCRMTTLATYVHHIDPVLWEIPGTPLAIRWYGLAYIAGFILGYLMLKWLAERKLYCISEDKLGDFITLVCLLGVLAGGRLGEFFFYWLPEKGVDGFLADPLWVLRVWEGGMASHGGMLCVILVSYFYARRHALSFTAVLDGLAIVSPIGLFFGRIANFINGELYGRITDAANPLAMKFPQEIYSFASKQWWAMYAEVNNVVHIPLLGDGSENAAIIAATRANEAAREALEPFLAPRIPTQLFEAAGEGLLLFTVLITVRLCWKKAPNGIFCAIFCLLYAVVRITVEYLKEPQEAVWYGITRGQYLSFALALLGIGFLVFALRKQGKSQADI